MEQIADRNGLGSDFENGLSETELRRDIQEIRNYSKKNSIRYVLIRPLFIFVIYP